MPRRDAPRGAARGGGGEAGGGRAARSWSARRSPTARRRRWWPRLGRSGVGRGAHAAGRRRARRTRWSAPRATCRGSRWRRRPRVGLPARPQRSGSCSSGRRCSRSQEALGVMRDPRSRAHPAADDREEHAAEGRAEHGDLPRCGRTPTRSRSATAVETVFNVKVAAVRTASYEGKLKRMGRFEGRRADWKKAIVTLAARSQDRARRGGLSAMGIRTVKPTSPARRYLTYVTYEEITKTDAGEEPAARPSGGRMGATSTAASPCGTGAAGPSACSATGRLPAREARHPGPGGGHRVRSEPLRAPRAAPLPRRREALHHRAARAQGRRHR